MARIKHNQDLHARAIRSISIICVIAAFIGIAGHFLMEYRYGPATTGVFLMGYVTIAVIGCIGMVIGGVLEKLGKRVDELEKRLSVNRYNS